MDDGRLIEYIQSFPNLYDRRRSDFKDSEKATQSWRQIAQLLHYSVAECMTRWKYLREKYSRVRKGAPSGSGASVEWEHFHRLGWLEPYIQKRKTKSNISGPCGTYSEASEMESESQISTHSDDFEERYVAPVAFMSSEDVLPSCSYVNAEISIEDSEVIVEASPSTQQPKTSILTHPVNQTPRNKRKWEARGDVETPNAVEPLAASLNAIGATMESLVANSKGGDSDFDEDVIFGKSVTAFLKKKKDGPSKNAFKKSVFNMMMDYIDE